MGYRSVTTQRLGAQCRLGGRMMGESMARNRRYVAALAAIGLAAITLAACSSSSSSSTTTAAGGATTGSVKSGGTITMALDENLSGFNINTSAADEFVLQEILDVVWPQPYIVNAALKPVLNTQLLTSVKETLNPQTVVYNINPKAVWQDGTPITADDFIYNWQAQSGNSAYTDVGNQPYDTASSSGYDQIASVTGSNPSGGAACAAGSAADRNAGLCPNGDTVTVKFTTPFADWQSLFINLVPAHIARTVGWNTGFSGPTQTISGSWYEIQSYNNNQSVVLVRNPKYWGTPGKLDKIVFSFFSDDTQEVPALQNGEVQIINPATVSTSIVQSAAQVPNTTRVTAPGLEFEHFDFNQSDPYLAKLAVRQAIAYGTNRQQIISHTVGEVSSGIVPLGNRMFVASQAQYVNNGSQYETVNPSKAESLLEGLGFKKASDGYFQPNYGPQKGQDLTFTIQSTSGNTIRAQTEQLFQAQMKAIGIKINIQNYDANTFFGTNLPNGTYQIAEFAWVSTPFVSGNQSIYCSYTNTANCGENWIHYANPQVDKLMVAGSAATSQAIEASDYNAADKILWSDMATLPLYQKPQYFAWTNTYGNLIPNTSNLGIPWNANLWGVKAS
jgi:peptide/nickel transport system substrate-binding protein